MCWLFSKRSFSYSGDLFNDEIVIHTNSTINSEKESSEIRKEFVGVDLFNKKIYHVVEKWKLFGFSKRDGVLIGGAWFGFIDPSCLVITSESASRVKSGFSDKEYKPYYNIIEKSESNIPIIDSEKYEKIDIF